MKMLNFYRGILLTLSILIIFSIRDLPYSFATKQNSIKDERLTFSQSTKGGITSVVTEEKFSSYDKDSFVFAVSPMASPVATASNFSEFVGYFSEKLGRKVVLKQRRTYSEMNELLKTGKASVAFTGTGAYLTGRHDFGLELLSIPIMNGKTIYNANIIVRRDSHIKSFEQFKNRTFAFTDPMSLTGKLYPTYLLNEKNILTKNFFHKTFYTTGHEKSIEVVANGLADGASVDSHILYDLKKKNNPYALDIKVIKTSESFGMPPFVVSPKLPREDKKIVLKILLNMAKDEKGSRILKKIGIDGFALPDHAIYLSAYDVKKKVRE